MYLGMFSTLRFTLLMADFMPLLAQKDSFQLCLTVCDHPSFSWSHSRVFLMGHKSGDWAGYESALI